MAKSFLPAKVEANYLRALDIARNQQAKSLELRASVKLSRLWWRQGKTTAARQQLASIYNSFVEAWIRQTWRRGESPAHRVGLEPLTGRRDGDVIAASLEGFSVTFVQSEVERPQK
jgi:hypothetical protein